VALDQLTLGVTQSTISDKFSLVQMLNLKLLNLNASEVTTLWRYTNLFIIIIIIIIISH